MIVKTKNNRPDCLKSVKASKIQVNEPENS